MAVRREHTARLERIIDEVKEFHPLLHRLLGKLPTVTSVSYTHGSREMGADFVLTRTHEILGTKETADVLKKQERKLSP